MPDTTEFLSKPGFPKQKIVVRGRWSLGNHTEVWFVEGDHPGGAGLYSGYRFQTNAKGQKIADRETVLVVTQMDGHTIMNPHKAAQIRDRILRSRGDKIR